MSVDVFAALADPLRRALMRRLAAGPARVVDLAAAHPVSRPAVSRHLRLLGEAGLVRVEERGRERHYRLAPEGLTPLVELLASLAGPDDARPPVPETALDALALEVRRTVRDRAGGHPTTDREEIA